MTRKSRIFSALAIAAAGALMITTTAYQSKAADGVVNGNYHIDDGTGYAGGEVAAVTGLNTTSTGTFRYDAPGTDEDIEIASGDIKSLENAVKALSAQVTGLGDTAKAADMALDTGAATAIGNLGTTNSTAMGQIKGSIDTLTQQINTLNETITNDSSGGANGTYGTVIKTVFGYVNIDECFQVAYPRSFSYFFISTGSYSPGTGTAAGTGTSNTNRAGAISLRGEIGPTKYIVWLGLHSSNELKTLQPIGRVLGCRLHDSGVSDIQFITTDGRVDDLDASKNYTLAPLV